MEKNNTLDTALELINEKKFEEAKVILVELQKENPEDIEIIRSLGLCNINLENIEDALENFKTCITENNEDALAWYYYGTIQELKNNLNDAKNSFLKVIELREDYTDAYKSLAVIYLKNKENKKVIELSQKLLELANDDYQTYYITGIANMSLENFDEAINLFQKGIEINPSHAVLYNNLGTALMSINNREKAIEAFEKAIELEPETPVSYYNVAVSYQVLKDHKNAFKNFKKAYELNPTYFYLNSLAASAINAGEWEDAIKHYQALASANPDKQIYQYNLACAYQAVKDYDKAISLLQNLNLTNIKSTQIPEKLAEIYLESGHPDKAKNIFANMISKGKVSPSIYYQYAMICAKTNDMDKAETILKKVLLLEPNNANAHKDLGIIYLSKRLFDYSKDEFLKAYELEPENMVITFELGNFYNLMSDNTEAQKYYDKIINANKMMPEMYLPISINLISLNELDKATDILSEALKLNPQNVEVIHNLAKIYFIKQNYKVAKELLEDAYFINPSAENANSLASVNFELEEYEEAHKLYRQIDQACPNNPSIQINIAKCQMKLNNNEIAKEYLDKVLKDFPESEEAQELLSTIK